ncbi:MAG: transposase [Idiomarina sp.]|uniref:Mu transposase C-terminal domain-containing protein n=1 Tax=Idiomarina sp. TaxID=1874361 RepID=UPI000C39C02F|nr:Mu transposase C-terminal domain-containing protein [Idiomarina sp.]MBT41888.1 transposase [Idiomarina sp.]
MWRVNDVVEYDNKRYRILFVESTRLVWLCIDENKGTPTSEYIDVLEDLVASGQLIRADDPFAELQVLTPEEGSSDYRHREKAYQAIKDIIVDEKMYFKKERAALLKRVAEESEVSVPTLYKYLRRYWQRGQLKNALLPDFKNSGGAGKSRSFKDKTPGQRRIHSPGTTVPLNDDIRRLFRRTIETVLLNDKSMSVSYAYRKFASAYKFANPDASEEQIPTYRQFQHFYLREYEKTDKLVAQTPVTNYRKDVRPLHGTATEQALGPGSRYEIDATIADIYLVDDDDSDKVIGRPTIYMVIDVFSRMVTGFYIGVDNPSYVVAMKALMSSFGDKTEVCKKYGIDISAEDWPSVGLPDVVLADRGELMSHQAQYLIEGLGVRLESAPPRRGDAKGIVERFFKTIQGTFKPYLPGVVEGNRVKKHGESDYRAEAKISMNDFTEIMLNAIINHNLHKPMKKYDRAADIPEEVPSVPIHLWNWGIQNRVGKLRNVDVNLARVVLLPRKKVTVSEQGVKLWGLTYTGRELIEAGWMHRDSSVKRPKGLMAAYDPGSANHIYLFPEVGKKLFWTCDLSTRSREFRDLTWKQVWERQQIIKGAHAKAEKGYAPKARELDQLIEDKVKKATKGGSKSKSSDAERIRNIKKNKAEARKQERRDTAVQPERENKKEPAKVVPIKHSNEETYDYPDYLSELFGDDSEPNS